MNGKKKKKLCYIQQLQNFAVSFQCTEKFCRLKQHKNPCVLPDLFLIFAGFWQYKLEKKKKNFCFWFFSGINEWKKYFWYLHQKKTQLLENVAELKLMFACLRCRQYFIISICFTWCNTSFFHFLKHISYKCVLNFFIMLTSIYFNMILYSVFFLFIVANLILLKIITIVLLMFFQI